MPAVYVRLAIATWAAASVACGGTQPGFAPGDAGLAIDAGVTRDGGAPSDGGAPTSDGGVLDGGATPDAGTSPLIEPRPYAIKVPSGYDRNTPTPLLLLLHGYSASAALQDFYFGTSALADRKTFLLAMPDGTLDADNALFWNATDACCGFGADVDDVAYLGAVLSDVQAHYNVDPRRIFVLGHSNGGFMAYRLACELSQRIAGIASLAGAMWNDASRCQPTAPVAVLQVHGTADATIAYRGGSELGVAYPSAAQSVASWATKNGCDGGLTETQLPRDFDSRVAGAETRVERHGGCRDNGAAELWTIMDGRHIPSLQPGAVESMYDFLAAHPKP